jgi:hypothetical protein
MGQTAPWGRMPRIDMGQRGSISRLNPWPKGQAVPKNLAFRPRVKREEVQLYLNQHTGTQHAFAP